MPRRQIFGSYELIERIGVGSLGEVYRAASRKDGRVVALKRLLSSSSDDFDVIEGLRGEAELVTSLDHPGIAKVLEIGEVDGVHFIAYAFVDGRDVRAIQERALRTNDGGLPARVPLVVALSIATEVLAALAYAHEKADAGGRRLELVHRDVSPPNLLVGFDGSVTLLDFGIAKVAGRSLRTGQGQVKGTLGYMSPEQVAGSAVDARSDIYSLAVCLWELVTGRRLFDGTRTLEVAQRIAKGEVPSARRVAATVPERLDRALGKALAQSPADRYAGATAFRDELLGVARDETLILDPTRVAQYVRSLFPEVRAAGAVPFEELVNMAENKGGSDLDVFEGLAKKSARPAASVPGLTPPPASVPPRKGTMVGLGAPPLPPASKSLPPSPPSMSRPPPPPLSSKAPPLPPSAASTPLPLPPNSTSGSRPSLPAVSAPPPKPTLPSSASPDSLRGASGSLPPPTITPLPPPPVTPVASASSSLPAPLPPPPKNGAASAKTQAAVDMDWDDDEESTHVYDKDGGSAMPDTGPRPAAGSPAAPKLNAGAAALMSSSGGAAAKVSAPPPPPPIPAIPNSPAIPRQLRDSRDTRDTRDMPPNSDRNRGEEETAVRPRPQTPRGGSSKLGIILGGLSLLVVIGLAVFLLLPSKGQLKIDIKSKGGEPIAKAEIFVDGVKKCDTTPCLVANLEQGSRAIKVIAPGIPVIERSENVEAGKEKAVLVEVESATAAVAPTGATAPATAEAATIVLKIAGSSTQPQVKVSVDGNDKGTLPLELKGLTAGEHKVKFDGGDRLEKREETVTLADKQTKDMGTVKLKVLKGQVTLDLQTKGADVKLVRHDGSKKVEKKLPDSVWSSPPVRIDINPSESWSLVATKRGKDDFKQLLDFEDGQAEKTIEIKLEDAGKAAPPAAGPGPGRVAANPPAEKPEKADKPEKAGGGGEGTLNMNAIPVSKVLLDGKPMGTTPKLGVSVPAGSHTVTFINPDGGRKSVTVQVKGGETKTAAVKF